MISISGSITDALSEVFNCYHAMTLSACDLTDEPHGDAGYICPDQLRAKDTQHHVNIPSDRIRVRRSLVSQDQEYLLIPTKTFEDIEAYIQLCQYISDWDRAYALSLKNSKLFGRVYRLYKNEATKQPIKAELESLLDFLQSAGISHQGQAAQVMIAQQIRTHLSIACERLIASFSADLDINQSPHLHLPRHSSTLPVLQNILSEAEFQALEKLWHRVKTQAVRLDTISARETEAQKTSKLQLKNLNDRRNVLKGQKVAMNSQIDHSQALDPEIEPFRMLMDLIEKRGQFAKKSSGVATRLKAHDPQFVRGADGADARVTKTVMMDSQFDPRIFLGRRGST